MQELIVAIFLVALFGFGAFARFLTLTYATISFLGKLLAEETVILGTVIVSKTISAKVRKMII